MFVASEDATSGSVIPKHERISPAGRGSSPLLLRFATVLMQHLHIACVRGRAIEDLGGERDFHFFREISVLDGVQARAFITGQKEIP